MSHRDRFLAILVVLLLLVGAKLAQQLFRHYSSRDERVEIARLENELREAGRGIVETKLEADSLRAAVESMDDELREGRDRLEVIERRLVSGPATSAQEQSYLEFLAQYNETVVERNSAYSAWQVLVERHGANVDRYNAIVDSIRTLATAIGEPYYRISSPGEMVNDRNVERERR